MKSTASEKRLSLTQLCVASNPTVSQSDDFSGTPTGVMATQPESLEWTGTQMQIMADTLGRRKGIQDQRGTANAFSHLVSRSTATSSGSQRSSEVQALKEQIRTIEEERARERTTIEEMRAQ